MPESKNNHWVENADDLERFVLGRIDPPEASKLELHLRECEACRDAVAREQELVAGIRRAGRENLKIRMIQNIERQKTRRSTWYSVVGVAAGIVLLVTIGVYSRWFVPAETRIETSERTDRTEKLAPSVPPQGQVADQVKPRKDIDNRLTGRAEQSPRELAAGAPKSAGREAGQIAGGQVDNLKDFKAEDAERGEAVRSKKDRNVSSASAVRAAATWVEGTVIPDQNENRPAQMEAAPRAADERAMLFKGKEQNLLAGKAMSAEAKEIPSQNVIVVQRLRSDLPQAQQVQRRRVNSIQTLLQKNPSGIQLTVYLDSLLTKKDFDQSRVQSIGEDSILLNLGNRRVGYKLPPEWTGQNRQIK